MTSDSRKERSSTGKEDYYDILGVSRRATDAEMKQAYRKLALELHPDKNSDPEATARFQAVGKAYKILGDPKLRSTYDLLGSQAADMIDQYEDLETFQELSTCRKFLYVLVCCVTGCGFGCACCCFFCCCCCFCDFCCNRCCGKCRDSAVSTGSGDEETENHSQQTGSIHRQPTDTVTDSAKF